jgi:hypothetical protein
VQKIILNTPTSPAVLFNADAWSNTTHNRPNSPRSVLSRCGRPGEVSLSWANAHLGLFFVVECESQHRHPFLLVSIADKRSKNHSRPIKSTSFSLFSNLPLICSSCKIWEEVSSANKNCSSPLIYLSRNSAYLSCVFCSAECWKFSSYLVVIMGVAHSEYYFVYHTNNYL